MSKKLFFWQLTALTAATYAAGVLSAQAAPLGVLDQAEAVLGSPTAQVPVQDPAITQAIEWIQQARRHELKIQTDSKSIGHHRHVNLDHAMILGGPETIPM